MFFNDEWLEKIPGFVQAIDPAHVEPDWVNHNAWYRDFDVLGEDGGPEVMRFYTIGALSDALGKKPVTVRRWIAKSIIPDSGMRTYPIIGTLGDAGTRLWTREQIEALVAIGVAEGVVGVTRKQEIAATHFSVRVWTLWKQKQW